MPSPMENTCLAVVDLARAGRFADIRERFAPALRGMVASEALQAAWAAEIDRCGPVVTIGAPVSTLPARGPQRVTIPMECQSGSLTLVAAIDADGWLMGLDLRSSGIQSASTEFKEEDTEIGEMPWKLPATLSMPRGPGPHFALVLVHGSGPNDRDESIGPNKPFRDLAWGLASRGVAVLRYEKRTRQYPGEVTALLDFTVMQETVEDVRHAVQTLAADPRIDSHAIFALGHSLGGYLMPRIVAATADLAGAVIWAGSYRPLATVMVEQIDYILTLPETTDDTRQALSTMRKKALLIPSTAETSGSMAAPFGVPASYWRDLAQYDPGQMLQIMTVPVLILQGQSDYQVTTEDFRLWQNAARGLPRITFKQYPHLNHCFIWTEGPRATPSTYTIPGHVATGVIEDIAGWIKTGHLAAAEG